MFNLKIILQNHKINVVAGMHENDHLRIFSGLILDACHNLYSKHQDNFGSRNVVFFHDQHSVAYYENRQGKINPLLESIKDDDISTYYFPINRLRGCQNRVYVLPAPTILQAKDGVSYFFNVEKWLEGKPVESLIWVDSSPYAQATEIRFLEQIYQHNQQFWQHTKFHICFYENMKATLLDIDGVDEAIAQATSHYQDKVTPCASYHRLAPATLINDLEVVLSYQVSHIGRVKNRVKREVENSILNFKYFSDDYQADVLDEIDFLTVFEKTLRLPTPFDAKLAKPFCQSGVKSISLYVEQNIHPLIESFVVDNFIQSSIDLDNIKINFSLFFNHHWQLFTTKLIKDMLRSIDYKKSLNRIDSQTALRAEAKHEIEYFFRHFFFNELKIFIERKHSIWQPLLVACK
ncbi:hypothetical protein [Psychromonas sp. Urea-02u-13]|uniref:hypothetical protein n=1 Tax=Psychromonas sp. Urea-02u-13 TaxID=2058326 RepID=UPI000C32DA2C|nr:hypothetical protein [Psychromonas sp. Urea-02u-13]PKG38330.1 hypothetical protein CXF74_14165 [Psychromonas sp. Urea-02u-13]